MSVAAVLMSANDELPEFDRLEVEVVWMPGASGGSDSEPFRRKLDFPVRPGIPALTVWKRGPAAILRVSRPSAPPTPPRRGWIREEPPDVTR